MARFVDESTRSLYAALVAAPEVPRVLRRRDLLALGVSDDQQSAMFRRGLLVRLRHGVYVLQDAIARSDAASLHRLHLAAAIAASAEPIWGFGASAALVHGQPLPFEAPNRIEVVRQAGQDERSLARPSKHPLTIPPMSVTTHLMREADVTVVGGIPVVAPPLAALSAARDLSHRRRVALFDSVLWDGSTTIDDLLRLSEEWRSRGRMADIVAAIRRARRGAQTPLETISRLALVDQGLPEPELQVAFHDGRGLIGYVDMLWRGLGVVGEADGRVKYDSREDLVREKVREDRLRALGLRVVRWMWDDIHQHPQEVARRIRAAGGGRAQRGGSIPSNWS